MTKLTIEIDNITEAQAIAIEDMFHMWRQISQIGRDRFVGFYVNGSEDFQPDITINGKIPKQTDLINTNKCFHAIKIKVSPSIANGLTETVWVDEADVYLIDNAEIQDALDVIENNKPNQE